MKKLRMIVFILLASFATTSVIAAGSDFAGPYVGVRMTVAGAVVDGSASNSSSETTEGAIGGIFAATGGEAGYTLPLGDSPGFITVGGSFISGGATFVIDAGVGAGRGSTNDATIEIKDHWSAFIAPGFALSETSAVYIKGGYAHADVKWEGDIQQGPNYIEGFTGAVGTRAMTATGLFIQTEAGVNLYDDVNFTRKANGSDTSTVQSGGTANGRPMVAYGAITIGMKF